MGAVLLLWDIDHTLTENNGVNKETYALAFELLTGRSAVHTARTEGRTEPEIMRGMLASHGIEPTPEHAARMPAALEAATLATAARLRERGHELPGARAALTAFQAAPEVVQSVLTGNIRPDAVIKLAAFALDGFIDFEAAATAATPTTGRDSSPSRRRGQPPGTARPSRRRIPS
jgi:phosphoglycolate phosphatase